MRLWTAAIALFLASVGAAMADCNNPSAILLAPGAAYASVASDDLVPTVECYQLSLQSGRELGVFVKGIDGGPIPAIEVYAPGWTAGCDASSECHVSGALLSEAGDTSWADALTETGSYLIVIDNPRGDRYRLIVEILSSGDNLQ